MSAGKGDTPRPILNRPRYERNWTRTFGEPARCEACGHRAMKGSRLCEDCKLKRWRGRE